MMEIERGEGFGDAAHRRDLRVVGSGRHVTPVRQRSVKVVSFVAKRVEQRPANHHHALMRAKSLVGRKQINIGAEHGDIRSEEHTSELQSLMRISYAVFCLKKKKQ